MYVHVRISCCSDQSANSISSRGDYSRAPSISFRACSGAATIRERRLFERGVYLVIYTHSEYAEIAEAFACTCIVMHVASCMHVLDYQVLDSACIHCEI